MTPLYVVYIQSVIKLYNISVSALPETKILQTNKKIYFSSGFHQQSVLSFHLKLLQIPPPNDIIIYCKLFDSSVKYLQSAPLKIEGKLICACMSGVLFWDDGYQLGSIWQREKL